MDILGISYNYHDAAASLVRDGVPIAAAEEERFSRVKHDARFPQNAIRFCLREGGISPSDLAAVAFYEKPARKLERVLRIGAGEFPASARLVAGQLASIVDDGLLVSRKLAESIGYEGSVLYCEHHLSHAASAFYCSEFDRAAILTVDGVGEWATCSQFVGDGRTIEKQREIHYPDSLGLLYSALTAYLGFRVNDDEYKVMGLASYGQPRFAAQIERLIVRFEDGSFALDPTYFSFTRDSETMYTGALIELLGPARLAAEHIEARHADIASSLQAVTEQTMIGLARSVQADTSCSDLCLAGGVAYNCVANSAVLANSGFDRVFVQPAAGDNGAALGAALWAYHEVFEAPRLARRHDTLLGPSFSDDDILDALQAAGVHSEQLSDDALCRRVADLIARDLIVAWFQGRMEFGPRALGSRSILANPCSPGTKDALNRRVKLREDFRPFAPAVVEEEAARYFEIDEPSPFMLFTPRVREEWTARIPAVTHVDGTARVQTVSATQNRLFHKLITCFADISGIAVLVNTSFNIRGEPIVCTPQEAINCFLGTDIDFLAIGSFLASKG